MTQSYYVTTPIYYVTDAPHIGHLYSTVAADIMSRYQKMCGKEVWFLTGTDEHGQKIQKKAKENNETPQALADRVVERYLSVWKLYGIEYSDFIRTTEDRHKKVVQEFIGRLMKTGDIYLGEYEGWYCVPDEAYWTETQVVDRKCPDCGRPVERLKEESYFFRMSKYQKALEEHLQKNPEFVFPETRKNEVLGFIRQGLKDISISRTTIQWGIPMPPDPKATKVHKVYVWFDALTNYISALGPLENDPKFKKFWPQAVHIVGKDILRFHAVYWPTFLLAIGLPLPKQIVAHGWLTDSNRKISKSLGNVVDPTALAAEVGVDGVRYFLFREFVFGMDGEYTKDLVYKRINSDLANDYGNAISRVCSMIEKYLGGKIEIRSEIDQNSPLRNFCQSLPEAYKEAMDAFAFQKALENIWKALSLVNRYIEERAPWSLAKSNTPESTDLLRMVLIHCHETLRMSSFLLLPFIPKSASLGLKQLGVDMSPSFESVKWAVGPKHFTIEKIAPLFPRLEIKKSS